MKHAVAWLLVGLCACGSDGAGDGGELPPLPWARETVAPPPIPPDNPQTPEKIHLGWLLFHDPLLSSDRAVACVTCHGQIWGLSDGLQFSIGIGGEGPAGTGRTGPTHTRRNSQALWNAAYRGAGAVFWDGRVDSLEAQVLRPLLDPIELGRAPEEVVADLAAIPEYVALFAAAFPGEAQPVTVDNMARAIAAFERTLISDNAPYDAYARGDVDALTPAQVRGMWLLAEVGCTSCHVPPLFQSDDFADIGLAPLADPPIEDFGRYEVTGDPADMRAFRVPTLRNIRESSPYMHDGRYAALEQACAHGAPRPLTPAELADLVDFLKKGLMDRSRNPPRALTVPSGLPVPLDGYSVPR